MISNKLNFQQWFEKCKSNYFVDSNKPTTVYVDELTIPIENSLSGDSTLFQNIIDNANSYFQEHDINYKPEFEITVYYDTNTYQWQPCVKTFYTRTQSKEESLSNIYALREKILKDYHFYVNQLKWENADDEKEYLTFLQLKDKFKNFTVTSNNNLLLDAAEIVNKYNKLVDENQPKLADSFLDEKLHTLQSNYPSYDVKSLLTNPLMLINDIGL